MKNKLSNVWQIENEFYSKSSPLRIRKIISHYEIFKKTLTVPGSIVECGVFKGNSLLRFIIFRDILLNSKKKVFGFDVFGKFPSQKDKNDNKFANFHNKRIGVGISLATLVKRLKTKNLKNFSLIRGPIEKTLELFLKNNKKLKISFLHLDLDVYNPTFFALEKLFKKVSKGGVILLDDYGKIRGATKATKDFLRKYKVKYKIQSTFIDRKLKFILKK
tara:strand:+ start:85 stop:738 length:654 start_codon:yes stop_codon:yes gene_type:complete